MSRVRKQNRNRKVDKRELRQIKGNLELKEEKAVAHEDYRLGDFQLTASQRLMADSFFDCDLTAVQGSSGTGKTTTAVYLALNALKKGYYRKIIFVKTPTESSDDAIGFLQGGANDKLMKHFEAMRGVFYNFMSMKKLELEEKAGRIKFDIPNFMQGATYDDSILIVDESQNITPKRLKLILERVGKNSKILLLGDKYQDYAFKYREDGFTDFVNMITSKTDEGDLISNVYNMAFVTLPADDNMRSDLSRQIVSLYENNFNK